MLKQGIACFQEDFFLIMVTKTLSPLLVVFCLKGFTECLQVLCCQIFLEKYEPCYSRAHDLNMCVLLFAPLGTFTQMSAQGTIKRYQLILE